MLGTLLSSMSRAETKTKTKAPPESPQLTQSTQSAVHKQKAKPANKQASSSSDARRDEQIETILSFFKTHRPKLVAGAKAAAAKKTKGSRSSSTWFKRLVALPKGPLYDVRIRRDVPMDKSGDTRADVLELEVVKGSTLLLICLLNDGKAKAYLAGHPSFEAMMKHRPTIATLVNIFGKIQKVPRDVLTVGKSYPYSGQDHKAVPIPIDLQPTFDLVESWIRHQGWAHSTTETQKQEQKEETTEDKLVLMGLVNYYLRTGSKIGAHSDDEREINPNVVVSYVAMSDPAHCRTFRIRDKASGEILLDIGWPDQMWGAMLGEFQSKLKHEVPWFASDEGTQRINLTVRIHRSSSSSSSSSSSTASPRSRKRKQPTADEASGSDSLAGGDADKTAVIPRPAKRAHVSSSSSSSSTDST